MHNSYFIAIIPPNTVCEEITVFKKEFALQYSSRHALKLVPHITLKAPFKLSADEDAALQQWFGELKLEQKRFQIRLKNFKAFHNSKPVVYVNVGSSGALYGLQEEIIKKFRIAYAGIHVGNQELAYSPHITVAYRDLSPAVFVDAWQAFKERKYESEFEVKDFHLLQHNGVKWDIIRTSFLAR